MDKTEEIPFEDAVSSWYENVYLPVINTIEQHHIMKLFKGRTKSDLYIYFIKYWDELKQRFGNEVSLEKAAEGFKQEHRRPPLLSKIKNVLAKHRLRKTQKLHSE